MIQLVVMWLHILLVSLLVSVQKNFYKHILIFIISHVLLDIFDTDRSH